jgi:hypothetical protein
MPPNLAPTPPGDRVTRRAGGLRTEVRLSGTEFRLQAVCEGAGRSWPFDQKRLVKNRLSQPT